MQMVRQYAVPHNQIIQITVPEEFNDKEVEIQITLVETPVKKKLTRKNKPKENMSHLIGKYKHYTKEQNEHIDAELKEIRDSWERNIF